MTRLTPRRVTWVVAVWLVVLLVGHRLFFQFRAAPVYVGSMPPMTARAQELLISQSPTNLPPQHRAALVGVRFADATPQVISRVEMLRIRGRLAWGVWSPYWVETVMIHDATHVTVRVDDSRITWVQLLHRDGSWQIERVVNTEIAPRLK